MLNKNDSRNRVKNPITALTTGSIGYKQSLFKVPAGLIGNPVQVGNGPAAVTSPGLLKSREPGR